MTMMKELATIDKVDLRAVWGDEASDFTPWLAEHLPILGEALGLDLELQSREAPSVAISWISWRVTLGMTDSSSLKIN